MTKIIACQARSVQSRDVSQSNLISRRAAVRNLIVIAAGSALVACKKDLACTDNAPEDMPTRTSLEYVDKSPNAAKVCSGCQLFKPAAPDTCGACAVVKGPINPMGFCKSWVQKT